MGTSHSYDDQEYIVVSALGFASTAHAPSFFERKRERESCCMHAHPSEMLWVCNERQQQQCLHYRCKSFSFDTGAVLSLRDNIVFLS